MEWAEVGGSPIEQMPGWATVENKKPTAVRRRGHVYHSTATSTAHGDERIELTVAGNPLNRESRLEF